MPQHNVPCDVLMNNRDNVERGSGSFHRQAVDYGDTDCAESRLIAKAKANMKRSASNHDPERLQNYLQSIRYRTVACQFANACTVDGRNRRQHMQVDRATVILGLWPDHLVPSLLLSFGFTHRVVPDETS
jgi:hypothetical protein